METNMDLTPLITPCLLIGLVIGGFLSLTGCGSIGVTSAKAPMDASYRVNDLRNGQ